MDKYVILDQDVFGILRCIVKEPDADYDGLMTIRLQQFKTDDTMHQIILREDAICALLQLIPRPLLKQVLLAAHAMTFAQGHLCENHDCQTCYPVGGGSRTEADMNADREERLGRALRQVEDTERQERARAVEHLSQIQRRKLVE